MNSGIYNLEGKGREGIDGTAFYYTLNLEAFQVVPLLSELARQITPVVLVATWISIYVRLLFPVLLGKYPRYVSLILLLGLPIGIGLLMGTWSFSLAMIALDMLFVRDSSWAKCGIGVLRTINNAKLMLGSEMSKSTKSEEIPTTQTRLVGFSGSTMISGDTTSTAANYE